jgi:RNA polymerase sigma factor (sigma-70 family)
MNYQENSFTSFDHAMTEETFSRWQGEAHESVDAYILRKRKAELYALVRKIIKNELNSQQQEIVRLHWYEGKNLSEIARIMGIDKSTVSRKEKKINEIIR